MHQRSDDRRDLRHRDTRRLRGQARSLARGLGWFSIGLGVVELLGTRALARQLGMEGHETLLRMYGVREAATGMAILADPDRAVWIQGRIAGNALDLVTLLNAWRRDSDAPAIGAAIASVAAVTALDIHCARLFEADDAEQRRAA